MFLFSDGKIPYQGILLRFCAGPMYTCVLYTVQTIYIVRCTLQHNIAYNRSPSVNVGFSKRRWRISTLFFFILFFNLRFFFIPYNDDLSC